MKTFEQLHEEAMELASLAYIESQKGNHISALENNRKGYELEKQSAMLLLNDMENEPTRSIIFKSAAWLAFHIAEYREAEKMIAFCLSGNPPLSIAQELRKLWKKSIKELQKQENIIQGKKLQEPQITLKRDKILA
jgi:hypothetical protein